MDFEQRQRSSFSLKNILIILFTIAILNLIVLDILIFNNNFSPKTINDSSEKSLKESFSNKEEMKNSSDIKSSQNLSEDCPNSCISKINEAIKTLPLIPSSGISQPPQPSNQQTASTVKEFFVPFGAGSSSSFDWIDVSGLQVYIDSTQYGRIKKVTFEASMHIPTGNQSASVRLYNVSDKHPVWFSEVSLEGGTPQLLISDSITLDSGNKLYQVQMKTSLKYQAILDQARIHILTY